MNYASIIPPLFRFVKKKALLFLKKGFLTDLWFLAKRNIYKKSVLESSLAHLNLNIFFLFAIMDIGIKI